MCVIRKYTTQDRSGGKINRTDEMLSVEQMFSITDYTESEINMILDLKPGEDILIGSAKDIYVHRTQ